MKSFTRLDSVVFQLTPTRTRCDLVISANGKTEKMASGLLNPFLSHLKTAQEQVAKGGYSIILEPDPSIDATWFTKGTVERFVRFVSTPEILERVYTVESEILQIEEAIAIQSNNSIGLSAVEEHHVRPLESIEGSRATPDSNEEKAIVLYTASAQPPEANGSAVQEGNSKVQLLKVLETRKTVLQKEQGMAFARAVAAGFDIDHMAPLMSFAESFGASRLRDACVKFTELWKRKHETGQWLEIEAAEAMSSRSDFSAMNGSGIVFSNMINKQKEFKEAWPEISGNHGKAGVESSTDEKPPMDQQTPGRQEYYPAQFPHSLFPPWPIHSPTGGMPTFQGYPMQGMPYYPNYPGSSPLFQQPYPSMEDPRLNGGQRIQKRHSMDSRDSHNGSDTWEMERAKSQDDEELENETSRSPKQRKKSSRSGKKQSGMVVIRNINYITSKRQNSSGSDSQSHSGSEMDDKDGDSEHKNSLRSSKGKGSRTMSVDREETVPGKEIDGGHWQAFQNFLLRDAEEEEHRTDQGMFSVEKEVRGKRRPNRVGEDPLVFGGREMGQFEDGNTTDMRKISARGSHMPKASNDQSLISRRGDYSADGRIFMDGQMDLHSTDIDGRRVYRRTTNDDYIIDRQQNQSDFMNSPSDQLALNGFERLSESLERRSSNNIDDDSYIVPIRSTSVTQVGTDDRNAINMDSEFSLSLRKAENISNMVGSQVNYEPDLSLMPERGMEMGSLGYDPALDYEMQVHAEDGTPLDKKNKEIMKGSKKLDKDRKSKLIADTSDKKKAIGPIRKGKPSKLSPLDEAKARAERLRTYKADLQKMKKEKEEAATRRLEALKMERQKRIASRGSSIPAQSSVPMQSRKQVPSKLSPSSHKGSKFTDAEPGSSSPLQRSIRTASKGSTDFHKASKPSKLNTRTHSSGNRLSLSVSSLPEPKKDIGSVTPDGKASMARIRRLSEPKTSSSPYVSSVKSRNSEPSSKTKVSGGPERKKISAIMNHDKSMIASLPELKIKTAKSTDVTHSKSGGNEMTQVVNGSISSTTDVTEPNRDKDKVPLHTDGDDSTVIEKTVVMLECEKPSSIPTVNSSEGTTAVQKENDGIFKIGRKNETVSDYAAIHAPVSSLNVDALDKEHQIQQRPQAYEVQKGNVSNTEKKSSKFTSSNVTEKPYQAPFARVSSLEDPCTKISEYGRAPPISMQAARTESENVRALVANSKNLKLEKIPEVLDKPKVKESSKGFRRLLKFGRKNHSSATSERRIKSDSVSVNGFEADELVANTASSSEVHTLKNLISQDETPTAGNTPQKSSLSFSLLSPFRSKTSEKKFTA